MKTVKFYRNGRYMGWRKLTNEAIGELVGWVRNTTQNTALIKGEGETVTCYSLPRMIPSIKKSMR